MSTKELFKVRDAIKILVIYFDDEILRCWLGQINKRLNQLAKEGK